MPLKSISMPELRQTISYYFKAVRFRKSIMDSKLYEASILAHSLRKIRVSEHLALNLEMPNISSKNCHNVHNRGKNKDLRG